MVDDEIGEISKTIHQFLSIKKYIAIDEDSGVYGYDQKPEYMTDEWVVQTWDDVDPPY